MRNILFISLWLVGCGSLIAQPEYSLQQLKDSARQHNVAILNARHDVEIAHQQRLEAFTKYFPNISAMGLAFNANKGLMYMEKNTTDMLPASIMPTLNFLAPELLSVIPNPITLSMMKSGRLANVNAVQPIFAGGKIINGNKLAKVGEDVSKLKLKMAENTIDKKTEQYYWQLVTLEEKIKTLDAVDALLRDIHKDVDVAVRAGVAMRNDLLQVQLRENDIESQRLKLQHAVSVLKMQVAQYCGLKTNTFAVAIPTMEQIDDNLVYGGQVELLPEYQLVNKQVEATKLQQKMSLGNNLPSLAVGASLTHHNLMDVNRNVGMIYATLSIPISDWWGGSHAMKQKKLEHQKAVELLNDNAQRLRIRMQKAWNDVQEARQQLTIAQRGIEQADENLRVNRNMYHAGTSRMSELLEAQLLYQQAMDKRTDALAAYHNKLVEYQQAIGK